MLQMSGDVLLIPLYAWMPPEKPVIGYQRTPVNLEIVANCPSFASLKMTPWVLNAYLAFAVLLSGDFIRVERWRKCIRREKVQTPDGGVIALDWWEEDAKAAAEAKRVLFVGSTFTGDAVPTVTREVCRHFSSRGWRCVVLVKRGCGQFMPNEQPQPAAGAKVAKPWCLLGIEDFELAIARVAEVCPGLPICGLGLSAGAAQLRNYVNRAGKDCKFAAAVVVDCSKEWAIEDTEERCPLIAKALAGSCHDTYDACHAPRPAADAALAGEKVLKGGLMEFIRDRMAPAHGYERSLKGARAYFRACEPPSVDACKVPVLEMVTMNDLLLTQEAALWVQNLYTQNANVVTVLTREGTHMVRWEGWWPRCWISRASAEFLEGALNALAEPAARAKPQA